MRSSQKRSMLVRGTKAVLPKQWLVGRAKHTFAILHYRGGTDIINIRGRLGRDFRSAWAFLD